MFNYTTYERYTKRSLLSHEHVTVRLQRGALSALSREHARSVGRRWERMAVISHGGCVVTFSSNCEAYRMVATQLQREGYVVKGIKIDDSEFGAIIVLESNGVITDPESIRGRIRRRSCNLGKPSKANRVAAKVSVADMHERLKRIKLERDMRKTGLL